MQPGRDAETARLLNLGQTDGLRRLLADHAGRVLALLRQDFAGVLNLADVEDALSEAVVIAWRRGERYEPSRGGIGTWLFAIARNCARRMVRASLDGVVQCVPDVDRCPPLAAAASVHELGQQERQVMAKEALAAVQECLGELEPRQQAVMAADLTQGGAASADDLAEALQISRNAVYVARNGARRAMHLALLRRGHEVPSGAGEPEGRP
ncbi:MAG: sigma-70 family RNA polymerase sigma factor [Planctomycetes bacterium]|nr:sigma-70 family RNA polymerase sigma factor [Planctomycetota bacterium]